LIRNTETIGKMDPYVMLEYKGGKYKTKTQDEGGKHPVWNETLTIPIDGAINEKVRLSCYEEDYMKDDFVGDMET